ncbi:transposase Tn3 family protein [Caldisalinibacter kiritimatiensis]|uniref:Transposase Tn3 family protein n=2 Tax=Caldisalinibacter kiritimatiensis TaxID=1304284 RepID=R1AU49_9FIRM|nr:transposase Tn3 family protein [Caldisalinibacter kiritimatiensis]
MSMDIYRYRNFTDKDFLSLQGEIFPHALENDNAINLMKIAISKLRKKNIILPGITVLEKAVNQARIKAEEHIFEIINNSLSKQQKLLMNILINGEDEEAVTKLGWLRSDNGFPSPRTFIETIDKLNEIRKLRLDLNIKRLHRNRIRQLYRLGSKYEPHSFLQKAVGHLKEMTGVNEDLLKHISPLAWSLLICLENIT